MKRFSTFTIAALVALALSATIGSAGASANTVLCSSTANLPVCSPENVLPAGSTQIFGGEMTLTSTTTPADKYICHTVGIGAQTTAESGAPLPAVSDYALAVAKCESITESSKTNCSSLSLGQTQDSLSMGNSNWTIGSAAAPLTISIKCFGTTCTFQASSAIEMATPHEGEFAYEIATITAAPMTRTSSILCPGGTSFTLDFYETALATDSYMAFSS